MTCSAACHMLVRCYRATEETNDADLQSQLSALGACAVVYSALKQGLGTLDRGGNVVTCSTTASVGRSFRLYRESGLDKGLPVCGVKPLLVDRYRRTVEMRHDSTYSPDHIDTGCAQPERWICDTLLAASAVYIALGVALIASDCTHECSSPLSGANSCIPKVSAARPTE